MEEFQGIAAPSNSSQGFHTEFGGRTLATSSASLLSIEEAFLLPLVVLGSLGGTPSSKGKTFPYLATSLSFFLFLRLADAKGLTKGGGRAKGS
nr:hypothetical protein CFP56_59970 [Quercus suber]